MRVDSTKIDTAKIITKSYYYHQNEDQKHFFHYEIIIRLHISSSIMQRDIICQRFIDLLYPCDIWYNSEVFFFFIIITRALY